MNIPVLYSDDCMLVCEKPVGISSQSPGLPDMISVQTGFPVWPVHRLDRGTGGVIILARSPSACAALQKEFLQDLVQKVYLAVVEGCPSEPSGRYEDLLFHDARKNKSYTVSRVRSGVKTAVCGWETLGSVPFLDHTFSLVRVSLHTGRTHQIRVQFGSRGMPLVGDRRYGSRIKADAPALWAAGVSLPHPFAKGSVIRVSSAPPSAFPWNLFRIGGL